MFNVHLTQRAKMIYDLNFIYNKQNASKIIHLFIFLSSLALFNVIQMHVFVICVTLEL